MSKKNQEKSVNNAVINNGLTVKYDNNDLKKTIAEYNVNGIISKVKVSNKLLSLDNNLFLNFYVSDNLIDDTMVRYNKYADSLRIKAPEKTPITADSFLLREIIRIFGLIGGQSISFDIDINSSIIDMVKNITFNKKHFTIDILQDIINTVNVVYSTSFYGKKFIFLYGEKYECIDNSTQTAIFQVKFTGIQAVKSALIQCNKTTANMFEKFTFNKISE